MAGVRLAAPLRELRIHLCQKGDSSKGIRDFLQQNYVGMKKTNPKFPILVRECSGVQPRLWARFDKGVEKSVSLNNLSATDVLGQIKTISGAC